MELKTCFNRGMNLVDNSFNRTAYGIEKKFILPLSAVSPLTFNRTAYGIENEYPSNTHTVINEAFNRTAYGIENRLAASRQTFPASF